MKRNSHSLKLNLFRLFIFLILTSFSIKSYSKDNPLPYKNQTDSIKILLSKCNTDTCRFYVLSNLFWKNAFTDIDSVKYIGEWAFDVIKNSNNKRALADGYDMKGFMFEQEESIDSAYFYFNKALNISISIGYKSRIASSYYHLGRLNEELGNSQTALDFMRKAIHYSTEINDSKLTHSSLGVIYSIYSRLGNYDSSVIYLKKMLNLYHKESDKAGEMVINFYATHFYSRQNNVNMTFEHLNRAIKIGDSIKSEDALSHVYTRIGDFFLEQKKNYKIALEYYNNALEKCSVPNYENELRQAEIYYQLGNIFLAEKKDSLALSYFNKCLNSAKKLKHRHNTANAYKGLGDFYKESDRYLSAIYYYKLYYNTGCNTCLKISFHDGLIEIGDCYLKLNEPGEAITWYKKSLNLAEKYHSISEIALSKFKLGDFYLTYNQGKIAENYYLQSIQLAEQSKNIALVKNIADTLCRYFLKDRYFEKSYTYSHLSQIMSDSLAKMDIKASLAGLEMKFEFEKINKENEVKEALSVAEIKRQKLFRNSFIIISGLFGILGFFILMSYKRKKRDNRLLSLQKDEILEKNQEIRTQIEEIKAQKDEIERISDRLHESDQMKLRFFSNISHEIRTPLTLIINPLRHFISSFNGNQEEKRKLDLIYSNSLRLNELTNQILDLQKLDSGNLKLNLSKDDIVSHMKGIISSFEGFCDKTKCTLLFDFQYSKVHCSFDKDKISKIVSNLLSNAFKYSNEGGEVKMSLTFNSDQLIISISDMGNGIPKEHIPDVFKRYYQLEISNTRYEGTGIGLAYVKELVEFMNGNVEIKSEVDKGTEVEVLIPGIEAEIIDSKPFQMELRPSKFAGSKNHVFKLSNSGNKNNELSSILVVEDNDDLRNFIGDLFKNEFHVIYSKDGKKGLKAANHYLPDLIISDIMMPNMDGIEFCSKVKKDALTSHIPVILLTAKDNFDSQAEGYKSMADDYIVKPFDSELLKLKVKNIIATREAMKKQFNIKNGSSLDSSKYSDTDKNFLNKCIEIIRQNMGNTQFRVEILSEELAFSRRNLYRKIKALTGSNPAELIRNIRMQHAAKLLKSSNLRIYEIALSIGYDNPNNFSLAFKKQFGVLPSVYITNN